MSTPTVNLITNQYSLAPTTNHFLNKQHKMLIGGKQLDAVSGKTIEVRDPATDSVIASVPAGNAADVDLAVKAARNAFENPAWANMRPGQREKLLLTLADLVEQHAEEFAQLEALDNGKSVMIAQFGDVGMTVDYLRYMAGWATKIHGETIQPTLSFIPPEVKFHAYTKKEPVGVVAAIIPWNFPLLIAAWKLGPALAVGCTVVLKPAEETPLTALRLGELILEAGYPEGVVNIVTGVGEEAGAALAAHPGIDKVAFTGSTEVGKLIGKAAVDNMTRFSLELGGKSPVIVLEDADIDMTVAGVSMGIFFNHGQVCAAGSRLYVHESIFDKVVEGIADGAANMKLGSGFDPEAQMGPLVSRKQQSRVQEYIKNGKAEGASVVTGGKVVPGPGYFVEPTVLAATRSSMTVVQEEIFGPVLCASSFSNLEDAIQQANDSQYGLASAVYSSNISTVHRVIDKLKAGTVWVNGHNMMDPAMPFGGYKQSGIGREMGKYGIDMYTETKSVVIPY